MSALDRFLGTCLDSVHCVLASSLLITLAIIKALAAECRRDMALLSPSLLASVNATLAALSADLEIAARAATVVRYMLLQLPVASLTPCSLQRGPRTLMDLSSVST